MSGAAKTAVNLATAAPRVGVGLGIAAATGSSRKGARFVGRTSAGGLDLPLTRQGDIGRPGTNTPQATGDPSGPSPAELAKQAEKEQIQRRTEARKERLALLRGRPGRQSTILTGPAATSATKSPFQVKI
jgi:hypothetical protein